MTHVFVLLYSLKSSSEGNDDIWEAMKNAGREEGWRPLTPMRVALMEFLAHTKKLHSEPDHNNKKL